MNLPIEEPIEEPIEPTEINPENIIIVTCPHCNCLVVIEKLNCCIFRHGILKSNGTQIPPHLNKEECDRLSANNLIEGCGKPFFVKKDENNLYFAKVCEYI